MMAQYVLQFGIHAFDPSVGIEEGEKENNDDDENDFEVGRCRTR